MTLPEDVCTPVCTTKRHLWRVQYIIETWVGRYTEDEAHTFKPKHGHVLTQDPTIPAVHVEILRWEQCGGASYPLYGARIVELVECVYLGEVLNASLGCSDLLPKGPKSENGKVAFCVGK